ncbi:PREDICTED: uncharacterized protein LOC104703186 [Camelina sativa]|uniref:Uncharacterized protein LOC104703186 n=1 Tax=Camelina sativa TaxID=90675 RepID=A0ABM0SX90_CAMSA|nr:PREDICTED: uncharacterized protein LOC104703186 [Camelina sativa]
MAGVSAIETEKYSLLEDFKVDVEVDDEEYKSFSLCFWAYLVNSTTFPSTIIRQVHSDMSVSAPFLVLDENKKMMLLPLTLLHKEAPDPVDTCSRKQVPSVSTKSEFPFDKWVHVGCEVSRNYMRLVIDGKIEGEHFLTSLLTKNSNRKISLFGVGGDGYSVQGFIKCAQVLPACDHVDHHYMKDPPLLLSVNKSSSSGIKLDDDGVWKASCGEVFSLDIVLSNAIGQPVHKDVEVVASLLYADTRLEAKMSEAEAPLLIRDEGVEFSSDDRPIKLLNGRSSFKLKISQLSSKNDNRLFWIKFGIRNAKDYPFLQAVSNPIRCISISPDVRPLPKRLANIDHPSSTESPDLLQNNTCSVKRIRLGKESDSGREESYSYQHCNSYPQTSRQFEDRNGHEEYNSPSGSENVEMRHTISDSTIFRYCLGNLKDKALLLKEITNNSSDEEVLKFANQVSLYSGCSHHSYQISMARELIAQGTSAWISMSRNNQHVHWDNVVYEIEEHFMRISKCSSRSLTHQDFELLRRISGCYLYDEYMTQENFENIWCWLFPVAYTISRGLISEMWCSSSPKWVQGFITKEEAEHSLQGQEPGTFILRFPVSRSWPHPDAGSLVVTYVGHDFALHHKQLNICQSSGRYMDAKLLQDMLLAEPELSHLGK